MCLLARRPPSLCSSRGNKHWYLTTTRGGALALCDRSSHDATTRKKKAKKKRSREEDPFAMKTLAFLVRGKASTKNTTNVPPTYVAGQHHQPQQTAPACRGEMTMASRRLPFVVRRTACCTALLACDFLI